MELSTTYTLDTETLRLNAYRLLCLFYANKEISRLRDPDGGDTSSSKLERHFFSREVTQLLLHIAIGVRVFDDQMNALPKDDPVKCAYLRRRDSVNQLHKYMMWDEMSLREACNKIIHANVVEPHSTEGADEHKVDQQNWLSWSYAHDESPLDAGPELERIKWRHLSGHIRLGGQHQNKQWWHLLEVPEFIEAVYETFNEG